MKSIFSCKNWCFNPILQKATTLKTISLVLPKNSSSNQYVYIQGKFRCFYRFYNTEIMRYDLIPLVGWIGTMEVNRDAELEPGETFCLCVSPGLSPVSRFTSPVPIHPVAR